MFKILNILTFFLLLQACIQLEHKQKLCKHKTDDMSTREIKEKV